MCSLLCLTIKDSDSSSVLTAMGSGGGGEFVGGMSKVCNMLSEVDCVGAVVVCGVVFCGFGIVSVR